MVGRTNATAPARTPTATSRPVDGRSDVTTGSMTKTVNNVRNTKTVSSWSVAVVEIRFGYSATTAAASSATRVSNADRAIAYTRSTESAPITACRTPTVRTTAWSGIGVCHTAHTTAPTNGDNRAGRTTPVKPPRSVRGARDVPRWRCRRADSRTPRPGRAFRPVAGTPRGRSRTAVAPPRTQPTRL